MEKQTHKTRVKKYLEEFGSITSWEAIQQFGNTRLSATIFDLRDDGMKIESVNESSVNRYGEPTSFVRYTLIKEEVKPTNIVQVETALGITFEEHRQQNIYDSYMEGFL
jgi:hypothetical protein